MKRNFLTLTLLLGVALSMQARQRTIAEMKSAAMSVIGQGVSGKANAPQNAQALQVLNQSSQLTVLGTQAGGFAVIANDDAFAPVLGYSDSNYSADPAPAFLWWMNAMNESLEKSLADGTDNAPVKRNAAMKAAVAPLITSVWGQGTPYNNLTPVYPGDNGQDEHYVVGCVATAAAQIMRYHKYPEKGQGRRTYRFAPGGGVTAVTLTANFGETTYDWDNMLDDYTGSYTAEQAQAAALISSHFGIAVKMTYTKDGSGSYSNDAALALRDYFCYSPYLKYYSRDYYPKDEWMNMVFRELNDGCPILYGGQSTSGGHAFILDGYDASGKVHVNWGWNGSMNGYFDIGSLNSYSTAQSLVQVRLPNDPSFPDGPRSIWALPEQLTATVSNGRVTLSASRAWQLDIDAFTGSLYIIAINQDTGEVLPVATVASGLSGIKFGNGVTLSNGYSFDATTLAKGTYRVCFASKSTTEPTFQPIRSKENIRNSYLLTVGDRVTLKADPSSNWSADWTGIDGITVSGDTTGASDGIVRVFDTTGRLVYQASKALYNEKDIPAHGILIVKDGTTAKKILK